MNNLYEILPSGLLEALGWALLHSLWQGILVALILKFVLLFAVNQNAAKIRYNLSIVALTSVFGLFAYTLYSNCLYFINLSKEQSFLLNNPQVEILWTEAVHNLESNSLLESSIIFLNQNITLIVLLWLVGVCLFSFRLIGGLWQIHTLKTNNLSPIPENWHRKLDILKSKINIAQSIQLSESSSIDVPMVIGYFKPIILLPLGTINGLSANQVEAILAHELAHIKRQDYLVNLLQSAIEIIFFYHPAVWWISNQIREERENCCDDIAVAITGDTLVYAKALTNLSFIKIQKPLLSMTAISKKNQLLHRIQRLLQQPNTRINYAELLVFTSVLLFCLVTTTVVAQNQKSEAEKEQISEIEEIAPEPPVAPVPPNAPKPPKEPKAPVTPGKITPPDAPTAPEFPEPPVAPKGKLILPSNSDKVVPVIIPSTPKQPVLKLPRKKAPSLIIPKAGISPRANFPIAMYQPKIAFVVDTSRLGKKTLTEIALTQEVEENGATKSVKVEISEKDGEEVVKVYEDGKLLSKEEQGKYNDLIHQGTGMMHRRNHYDNIFRNYERGFAKSRVKQQKSLLKAKEKMAKQRELLRFQERQLKNELKRAEVERERALSLMEREQANELRKLERFEANRARTLARIERKQANELRRIENERMRLDRARERIFDAEMEWLDVFKAELIKDGIIKDGSKKFNLKLNKNGFWVNGKKQSKSTEEKYRQLYKSTTGQDSRDTSIKLKMKGKNKFRIKKSDVEEEEIKE